MEALAAGLDEERDRVQGELRAAGRLPEPLVFSHTGGAWSLSEAGRGALAEELLQWRVLDVLMSQPCLCIFALAEELDRVAERHAVVGAWTRCYVEGWLEDAPASGAHHRGYGITKAGASQHRRTARYYAGLTFD